MNKGALKNTRSVLLSHTPLRLLVTGLLFTAIMLLPLTPAPAAYAQSWWQLRNGEINLLIISKVGSFSIDLPDVNVAIQISGTFGSRQEEAQRLGRILRPKRNGLVAHFYSLVSRDTREQEFAAKRQLFLTEQGYHYEILYDTEVQEYEPTLLALQVEARKPLLTAG